MELAIKIQISEQQNTFLEIPQIILCKPTLAEEKQCVYLCANNNTHDAAADTETTICIPLV